ncbi:MAG: hypothetical protein ABSB54_07510 [Acidimicrobiales bacterium]
MPVLGVTLAGSLLPAGRHVSAGRAPAAGVALHVARASSDQGAPAPFRMPRPLPAGRSATAGVVPFSAAPPKHHRHAAAMPAGASDGVPAVAIAAYSHAGRVLAVTDPTCHLSWEDVAGIGRVESDNGQTWGAAARVTRDGTLFPPIFGVPLNGLNGTPAMRAPGGGWVRAEGPMQFLPATWAEYAQHGNGDRQRNPQNFYAAALTAGVFLCANGGDLDKPAGLKDAILAYNHSAAYESLVESWISFYAHVGKRALQAAGSGLLPTGTPSARTRHGSGPSAAAVLAAAAASSESTGSFSFGVHSFAGKSEIGTGTGAVDTRDGMAWLALELRGSGTLQLRLIGGVTYVSLPPALGADVGAEGPWIVLTPSTLSRLPAPFASGLALASADLRWIVGQLTGACDLRVVGHDRIGGAGTTEYSGQTNLSLARQHLADSAELAQVARLVGSSHLHVQAWVTRNRIRSAVISLGRLVPGTGPISLHLSFTGYGERVTAAVPSVSPTSPTTTSSTTTTTTTTPTTTTTTSTTTTTTTTTTSLPS